jgi:hypothetical protein
LSGYSIEGWVMSEANIWDACHVRTDTWEEAESLLQSAALRGYAFEPARGWSSLVIDEISPEQLVEKNPGILLHLFHDQESGWGFSLYQGARVVSAFSCDFGETIEIYREHLDVPGTADVLGLNEETQQALTSLFRRKKAELVRAAPSVFAELIGLGPTRSLSIETLEPMGVQQVQTTFGRFRGVGMEEPPTDNTGIPSGVDAPETEDTAASAAAEAAAVANLVRLLEALLTHEKIELIPGARLEPLAAALARVLDQSPDPERFTDWLLERPEVEDVFLTDEEVVALLRSW